MNISDSVYWDVERSVVAIVGRDVDGREYSDVDDEYGSSDGERV